MTSSAAVSEAGAAGGPALSASFSVTTRTSVALVSSAIVEVAPGGSLGIVGESGSGKSLTLRALMGILPTGLSANGTASWFGSPLPLSGARLARSRRGRLGMIFQEPLSALDPVMSIGDQVAEAPRRVEGLSRRGASARAMELLRMVRLPDPESRASMFPHQLSGGLRQRVMIAVALSTRPQVLLCDEPTTALDMTIQAEILALLTELRERLGMALIFVSHDLAVVSEVCEDLIVMYSGRAMEVGPVGPVLSSPRHPYTAGLVGATPSLGGPVRLPVAIPGALPDPARRPSGCVFAPRCSLVEAECTSEQPPLVPVGPGGLQLSACRRHELVSPS
jgi:peptide/nickel transport system ATP-binding protein